ncbi:MAG: hypothetical protein HUU50_21255 [Candidatus Brocadiae bacterium]|nr:hypothetical protein [Candidatus Brocadiia bacterium]
MNNIPENLMPFMKEVLVQLEGKIPEDTLEKLAKTLLREMQYQQLRDTAYGTSHSALSEVRQSLKPLEDMPKTQRYLVDNVKSLLIFQEETKKNYTQLMESIERVHQYTQKSDGFFLKWKESSEKEEKQIQEEFLLLHSLEEKLEKIAQDWQSLSQKQGDSLHAQIAQIQKELTQYAVALKSMEESWQKKSQESFVSQILQWKQEIQKSIQDISVQGKQEEFAKKLETLLRQDLQSLEQKTFRGIESLKKDLESSEHKVPAYMEKSLQDIARNLEKNQQKLFDLESFHSQSREHFQKNWMDLSQKIQELSSQLYRIQENNARSPQDQPQENLQEFKNMLMGVKGMAQSLQILQHLPERLNIPENFSAVVESIPASNRKIKEYIELFRQDLSLVSQHSLELLKAHREQTTEFAKLQTALLPEIHSLQQNWQKFSLKLDDHWSGSQEILGKNMGELVSAIAQIKVSLNQLGQQQDRPKVSYDSTGITQEIKDYVRDRMEIAVQNIKENLESAVLSIKKELKSVISQEVRLMGEEIKASWQSTKSQETEKSKKSLQPLENILDEMSKTMNRIDLRMVSKESQESSENKVSSTCPHCGKEVIGPVSFQGKRVSCPSCKEKFTFPTIIKP